MFVPIIPEALVQELYEVYGVAVSLDYAINYIEMNEYATVNDFYDWLHRELGVVWCEHGRKRE